MAKIKTLLLTLTLVFLLVGCQNNNLNELTEVNVQLKWLHQSQFAGHYVAKEKGFYEEKGLYPNFFQFEFINFPIDSVQDRSADFAITGADELIIAKSQGHAEDVKAIGVIYRRNPVAIYSLKESNINTPDDIIGKTVGLQAFEGAKETNVVVLYKAMLTKLGLNREQINELFVGYGGNPMLLDKEIDLATGYVINEPFQINQAGKEFNTILPADYGVNMYADIIITNKNLIETNPKLVKDFLEATLNGWKYAIENQKESIDYIKIYSENTRKHEEYMLESSARFIRTGDSFIGLMEDSDWESAYNILKEQGMIEEFDYKELHDDQFVEEIYGE